MIAVSVLASRLRLLALVIWCLALPAAASAAPRGLLLLDFEIVDTSNEPVDHHAEHARRLRLARDAISDALAAGRAFRIVDPAPIRGALDRILEHQYLRACNGCELDLARSAGADLVLLGRFNKISTLIGSMSIAVEDARSGALLYAQSFGFRGDTDEAWLRAAKFFAEKLSAASEDAQGKD